MLKFDRLVEAIQHSVISAAQALRERNREILYDEYFHMVSQDTTVKGAAAASDRSGQTAQGTGQGSGQGTGQGGGSDGGEALVVEGVPEFNPRMVAINFPKSTPDGPDVHTVMVPLISVLPINHLAIQEMAVELDLEIQEDDGELTVGFVKKTTRRSIFGDSSSDNAHNLAKITIKVKSMEAPDGFQTVVDGYDKVLRAQVPT